MKKKLRLLSLSTLVLGIFSLGCSLYYYAQWQEFQKEYEKTFGIIIKNKTDKDKQFHPVIRFKTLDNQSVIFTSIEKSSRKYAEGDTVEVYYDLLNPDEVYVNANGKPTIYFFFVLAIALVILGISIWLFLYWRSRKREQLRLYGTKVSAKLMEVKLLADNTIDNQHAYRFTCMAVSSLTGVTQQTVFESDILVADPTPYLANQPIDVYVDAHDHQKYYVDISFLPQEMIWL